MCVCVCACASKRCCGVSCVIRRSRRRICVVCLPVFVHVNYRHFSVVKLFDRMPTLSEKFTGSMLMAEVLLLRWQGTLRKPGEIWIFMRSAP